MKKKVTYKNYLLEILIILICLACAFANPTEPFHSFTLIVSGMFIGYVVTKLFQGK
jgi:general stress protein CsbA